MKNNYEYVIFSSMKNEAPYILDWISYHLAIGFTHFAIATNDCDDGTDNLLRQLSTLGIVSHKNNPGPHPQGIMKHALNKLQTLEAITESKWLMGLDADEFLRIDIGRGEIPDLRAAIGFDTHAVSFVTQVFGASRDGSQIAEPIIASNLKSSHPLQAYPSSCMPLKTLFQNEFFEKIGAHKPIGFKGKTDETPQWFDADGCTVKTLHQGKINHASQNGWAFGTALGRVNHYPLKSIEEFAIKWGRGVEVYKPIEGEQPLTPTQYWQLYNWNNFENAKITRHLEKTIEIKNHLLSFDKIKKLHKKTLRIQHQIAKQARRKNTEFFESIDALGPSQIGDINISNINGDTEMPKNKWVIDIKKLYQKLIASNLLKFYLSEVDYSSKSIENAK